MSVTPSARAVFFLTLLLATGTPPEAVLAGATPASPKAGDKIREGAGEAEFLRLLPKRFAILQAVDTPARRVTLLVEGENLAKVWRVLPDAEIKCAGWWGRLDQLVPGTRIWVWFQTDRAKNPAAVVMLADELSEQDIHGRGYVVAAVGKDSITLKPPRGQSRTLLTAGCKVFLGDKAIEARELRTGQKVLVESNLKSALRIVDAGAFEKLRARARDALRERWRTEGLPGTISFLHPFSGEMEVMLDHEAMRWGRSLQHGDAVRLAAQPPIAAAVKQVHPWRERTLVGLVVHGVDQADLHIGQRVHLLVKAPAREVDNGRLPPDLGRPRSKAERIDWFLASVYCSCGIAGDTCTGHFYTLASCNPNGCGMPNAMRQSIAGKIDRGLSDRQIFEELLKEQGPDLLRQHLAP